MSFYIILISFLVAINCIAQQIDFSKISGWELISEVNVYDSDNLWEYNNGAADQFLSYGFQMLHNCDLQAGKLQATVDIFDMDSRLNAFGIYNTQSPKEYDKLNIGVESLISPPIQCLLLKNRFYVMVSVYEGEITDESGKVLLESIAAILPGSNEYPDIIKILPQQGIEPLSERFTREGFLGLTELNNCVSAKYKNEQNVEFEYFLIVPVDKKSNSYIWKKLESKWKQAEYKNFPILYRKIPYKGIVGVVLTDKGIFGGTNSQDQEELFNKLDIFVN